MNEDEWSRLNPRAFELNRTSPKGTRVQVVIGERSKKWEVFFLLESPFPRFDPKGVFDTWDEASAMAKLFLINED